MSFLAFVAILFLGVRYNTNNNVRMMMFLLFLIKVKKKCVYMSRIHSAKSLTTRTPLTNFEGFNRFQGNYQAKKKYLGVKGVCVVFTYPIAII